MKNIFKLILITSATFFLFACDSSNTASTPAGKSYLLSVKVTGFTGTATALSVVNGNDVNDILKFPSDAEKSFSKKVASGSSYKVTIVDGTAGKQTCTPGSNASSDSIQSDVVVNITCDNGPVGLTGNLTDGEIYYMSECAVCHKAGTADPTKTFASSDVAENYKIAKNASAGGTNINPDMHSIGPTRNLMGRFDAIPAQSVADLEVYLLSVAP